MIDYNGAGHGSVTYSYNPLEIKLWIDLAPEMVSDSPQAGWAKIKIAPKELRKGKRNRLLTEESAPSDLCSIEGIVADPESAYPFLRNAFLQLL
ncbi:hypothetical protein SAMN06272771_5713 [Streptomyces sp. Ag82_O1-12]|nr:hypothetical protein SAMN06272771_5713 [Streptomyces sp. Ag82_O1-12]SOD48282.1 hypothetical protein SAMN06272727_5716 [Streptomyces sp. Ag82_G6-1]